ncbi:MAG: hypothetical protein IPG99_20140 [Ignavibacteria bacterium]|nr:hypothetical protein [Ignavibacteria bacterium]
MGYEFWQWHQEGFTNPPPVSLNVTAGIEGFYNGMSQIADTVRVILREASTPFAAIDSSTVFLNNLGNTTAQFSIASDGNYYVQFIHRNALETWTASAIALSRGQTVSLV